MAKRQSSLLYVCYMSQTCGYVLWFFSAVNWSLLFCCCLWQVFFCSQCCQQLAAARHSATLKTSAASETLCDSSMESIYQSATLSQNVLFSLSFTSCFLFSFPLLLYASFFLSFVLSFLLASFFLAFFAFALSIQMSFISMTCVAWHLFMFFISYAHQGCIYLIKSKQNNILCNLIAISAVDFLHHYSSHQK